MSNMVVPASGEIKGKTHIYPVRIFFEDTDAGGIVYHANYLKFAERARSEFIRAIGWDQREKLLSEENIGFAVRHCEADYKASARLEDVLEVQTTVTKLSGASMVMNQSFLKDGQEIVNVKVKLACLVLDEGIPYRMPSDLKDKIKKYL